jgi:hypothetical protein
VLEPSIKVVTTSRPRLLGCLGQLLLLAQQLLLGLEERDLEAILIRSGLRREVVVLNRLVWEVEAGEEEVLLVEEEEEEVQVGVQVGEEVQVEDKSSKYNF